MKPSLIRIAALACLLFSACGTSSTSTGLSSAESEERSRWTRRADAGTPRDAGASPGLDAGSRADAGRADAGAGADAGPSGSATGDYVVFAWNDLGMHCLNPTYDSAVILPPYNDLVAQVVKRGATPQIVTSGVRLEYRVLNNTYSYGKRSYGQFWDNSLTLFGVSPARDTGLNLVDPAIHNGLSGTMLLHPSGRFEADGIPVTPVDDSLTWNPYQVAEISVKDASTGQLLAQTQATIPTSDEISCDKCHGATNTFANVLQTHDARSGTHLAGAGPVLCASCHGSPVLGQSGPGSSGKYLSQAMHGFHASTSATCYDCHPGGKTQCSRSLAHTAADGNCTSCHGTLSQVASSITSGGRVPWVDEPKCTSCHTGMSGVDTGTTLYRNAAGHGGLACAACHGSPHAMVPTRIASDNFQAVQYQGKAVTIGSCAACHSSKRGGGSISEFGSTHGGTSGRQTACNVCHTSVTTDTASWPHAFTWPAN